MNIDEFLSTIKKPTEKRSGSKKNEPESVFGRAMSRKRPVPPTFNTDLTVKSISGGTGGGSVGAGAVVVKKSNLRNTSAAVAVTKPDVVPFEKPDAESGGGAPSLEMSDEERLRILQMVENEPEMETPVLDDASLKRMISLLEKRVAKNQEMRIKFVEQPEKFMDSELELHESIQELHSLATMSDLYPLAVDLNLTTTLISLLAHENGDISCAVLDLLQEITDLDTLNENEDATAIFIDSLLDQQGLILLVQNLDRLDETLNRDESDGIHNTLAIFENLFELRPALCSTATENGLLAWLLKRIKARIAFDGNKLYSAEMLAILLQDTIENRVALGELDGIDILLQQLAVYKRYDPVSNEESEYMENLFNCLCSALLYGSNREKFLQGEGPQLMNLMLREKKQSRNGALKVLDHAVSGPEGTSNANKIVEILGLRTIFPLFMKTPKKSKRKGLSIQEYEEHVISILSSLFQHLMGSTKTRLLSKFEENNFEKVERLIELHFKYLEKIKKVDAEIQLELQTAKAKGQADDDLAMDEDEIYMKRLENGLFTLQLIDYVILEVCVGNVKVKDKLCKLITLRKGSLDKVKEIVEEYGKNLGDENQVWKERQLENIKELVEQF